MDRDYYSPFEIVRLDRYSDEMIRLGRDLVIKMNVTLAKTVKDNRYFFYREYEYSSGRLKRVSIKRVFDYFLSIEEMSKPKDRDKIYVRISQLDYVPFWNLIQVAKSWFTDKEFKNLYGKKDGMLVVAASPIPTYTLPGLPMNVTLTIAPTVIDNGYAIKEGIELLYDNGNILASFPIPMEVVFALYSMFPPVYNLYHEASTMLAALNIPIGTNRVDMSDKSISTSLPSMDDEREFVQKSNGLIDGRKIGHADTIDDLE